MFKRVLFWSVKIFLKRGIKNGAFWNLWSVQGKQGSRNSSRIQKLSKWVMNVCNTPLSLSDNILQNEKLMLWPEKLTPQKTANCRLYQGFPSGAVVKNPCAKDMDSIPGWRRSCGGGNGNPLQYFSLKSPWAQEPGRLQFMRSQKSGTRLSTCAHSLDKTGRWSQRGSAACDCCGVSWGEASVQLSIEFEKKDTALESLKNGLDSWEINFIYNLA